jgi:hypothetical protein
MPAFGVNRFTQAYAVAVSDAGTRINDKPLSCVDRLVSDLWKWAGSKPINQTFRFLYPFVGGTAVSNSFNLADPAFGRIEWEDIVTHNANGITGDGVSGLGNTGVTMPSNAVADWLVWCGVYSRTASTGNWEEIGNYPSPSASTPARSIGVVCRFTDGQMYAFNGPQGGTTFAYAAVPNSQGLFSSLRNATVAVYAFRNGVLLASGGGTTVAALDDPMPQFVILRGNPSRPCSPRNLAFAYLTNAPAGLGSAAKQVELYNYVQFFQTKLGRQV